MNIGRSEGPYVVAYMDGVLERRPRTSMTHAEAMIMAEDLQRMGWTVQVLRVVDGKEYEVDRYPPR